ncbi:MAG TPA: LuxR family transcriptional regulator [Flavobacteriaceae bacterium]|nr:LuxR family transcriptional regulator [Flavobacteriaceae bacterium]
MSRFHLLAALFILAFWPCKGQELPPVVNYPAEVYGANNQNWMLSQGPNNEIYAANNDGLLRYNGSRWSLFPTPNQSVMRSVNAIGQRIYTGFYMDFGYWLADKKGGLVYTSLMQERSIKPIEDEQFWQIFTFDKWLVTQSLQRLIMMDLASDNTVIVEADHLLSKAFVVNGQLYFHDLTKGLYTVQNGQKQLVNQSELTQNGRLVGAAYLDGKTVFVHETRGLFVLEQNNFVPWSAGLNQVLSQYEVYSSIDTPNGALVLGTIADGILALDKTNQSIKHHFTRSNGIENNTVLSLYQDVQSNIWAGLDNGITCINAASNIRPYLEQNGQLGTTYASAIFQDNLYLGTNQGLFFKPLNQQVPFEKVPGTAGQVWSLAQIGNTLFCGHNAGTFIIDQGRAKKISDIQGAWDFKPLNNHEDVLVQGNYDGLYLLKKTSDGLWLLANKIQGFDYSAKHFEVTSDNQVVVSHEYKGVFLLNIDERFEHVLNYSLIPELKKGLHSDLESYQGSIYYASEHGVFQQGAEDSEFTLVPELSQLFNDEHYTTGRMIADGHGRLWFFTDQNLVGVSTDPIDGSYQFNYLSLPQDLRQDLAGHENLTFITADEMIYGNAQGYLRITAQSASIPNIKTQLDQLVATDAQNNSHKLSLEDKGQLGYDCNNLRFDFHFPEYGKYNHIQYAYRISPLYNQWSEWSEHSHFEINNLPPDQYSFEVRTMYNGLVLDSPLIYTFEIVPPWYASTLAIMIYILIGTGIIIGLNLSYRSYYKRQRDRMLKAKTADLELRDLAAQKEIMALKNQQLKQDIEARNRELAISTMSMIRKNTTLNKLKSELVKTKEETQVIAPALSIIDQALKNDEDWEFFEQAFNHADKKFFKRIKEKHPSLTPNDLRLCVYLRLNLSSKEIAPLLNISARSVEIKRYRLRKKLDLERDVNLSEYVINL